MDNKISQLVSELFDVNVDVVLTRPDVQFGDYATNVAMQLAKPLSMNPRDVAEILVAKLLEDKNFSEVTVAGPGFINMRMSDNVISSSLHDMITAGSSYKRPTTYKDKIVVTEYSDPNPFKVLHAGHLYTSIIGDVISNLIEYAGGSVHRVNFGGDVGLHVGKTMWAILQNLGGENVEALDATPEDTRSEWMAGCYVEGTRMYEENEAAKAEIIALNKKVYQLHADNEHDTPFAKIYWTCRQWSYDYFDAFYARIDTPFEKYYPESTTAPLGLATVIEQKARGVYKESNGATIFEGEPYGLHTRVFINSEGLPTYEAKDVGLSIRKWDDYHFNESIIITGNDITEYMKVVLKSIEQFKPELVHRTKHFTHGNVKLVGGVKMSSRKGNFLRAIDVIEAAADANEALQGNRDDGPIIGAIKYAFLKSRIGPDIIFDPKESISIHGNSGPYLQYAHARANSIIKKAPNSDYSHIYVTNFDQYERTLMVKMMEYMDVLEIAVQQLAPHHICTYLYELAQEFNRFYEQSKVIGSEREPERLQLVEQYKTILASGLRLLGIAAPEQM
jgi:arginyl-tRNA synthetase